jgi:NAD(P)H-hydrate epimerase
VLTPHPGEAARLLGCSARDVNADRIAAATALSTGSECVVLLKGAGSVVADPTGRVRVNPTGNPALGSGGTGDVLTGVVAALLAQGLEALDAATAAAYLHGAAADGWAETHGEAGLAAEDLADAIPATAARLRRQSAVGAAARASDARAGRTDLERALLPFPFGR